MCYRFASCGMDEEHHNTVKLDKHSQQFQDYHFFLEQLDLLAKMAFGRNETAIEIITTKYSFEECFMCLQVYSNSNFSFALLTIWIRTQQGRCPRFSVFIIVSCSVLSTSMLEMHWM